MDQGRKITVALVWAQFAAYHIDRCEAVASRLGPRAEVLAVEIATTSADYAWEPSGQVDGAHKITLFPGQPYDKVPRLRLMIAALRLLRRSDWVMIGLSYGEPWVIALTWLLRLMGGKVVVFSESKADDRPRRPLRERVKRLSLSAYHAAIVGGRRHMDYFRTLGFSRRPVIPGYDGVGVERVRAEAGGVLAPQGVDFADRDFVFVGRFVDKKNLPALIDGFAGYVRLAAAAQQAGAPESRIRRLVLAGSGDEERVIRERMAQHGIAHLVDLPGFLPARDISALLTRALALVLVSREEQWGLVVNEALALGLPAIVSTAVGSRDALVRDGVNGHVVSAEDAEGLARALFSLAESRLRWEAMVAASHQRAWMGDTARLADAVETVLALGNAQTAERLHRFIAEMRETA